ncbi:hypothetical protein HYH03_015645 [Edaphochlamys debaryana]|uniref:MYND-type domain-containing protein n=1 Tax=Edaphochlamys debaryana TaxID=47281 RepID=A0A835XKA9_9CHLO|nr:hypothetical protein HYH03_015645 [Edaphochlamys debaryana]|eukprot:KAG2485673.1 hypothetical protein HYH03_015645 [Edaphochlamys debaryana]
MSELNYTGGGGGAKGPRGVDYASQQAPHQRNRVDSERWARVEAENAVMARKLADIRREPPAGFHAPRGYGSVAEGQRRRQERKGKPASDMPETQHYVAPTPWPPAEPAHEPLRRARAEREASNQNSHLASKLRATYGHRDDSLIEHNGLGSGLDCNDRWAGRTALYDTSPDAGRGTMRAPGGFAGAAAARSSLAAAAASGVGCALDLEQASVPKSLGVARCGGCGASCFYAADGPRLMRCRACKAAWYCSEACAKLDYTSHKALCKYHTTGHWAPGGLRPAEEMWVNNAAMAVVRQDLRRRAAANTPGGGGGSASGSPASAAAGGGGGGGGGSAVRHRPRPSSASAASTSGRSPAAGPGLGSALKAAAAAASPRRSVIGFKTGIQEMDPDQVDGEMDVYFELDSKYKKLREMEIAAEKELAEVEFRANNGLDGPRPCMYVMKRFAEAPPKPGTGRAARPVSAGPKVQTGNKPAWQDTASFL